MMQGASEDEVMIASKTLTLAAVELSAACPVLPYSSLTGTDFQR